MIDTPSVGGSIDLKGGKIDDIILKDYHETVDPKSPNVRLFSPPGAPDAYWAETGFVSPAGAKTPDLDTVWTADRPDADPGATGDADLGQWRGSRLQARHRGRRQIHVHDHGLGRELRQRAGDRAALRARPAPRQADCRRLFGAARGLCRRDRRRRRAAKSPTRTSRRRPARSTPSRATAAGSASPTNIGARRSFPTQTAPIEARFSASGTVQPVDYQADFLGKEQTVAPGATVETTTRVFAGAKEVVDDRQLRRQARHQEVRSDDRLGLVLFHHQADVPADRRDLQIRRQFRRRDPDRHGPGQARLLPARQSLLPVDGEDEEDPAADRRAEGPLSRRQASSSSRSRWRCSSARASIRSPAACRW